MISWPPEVTFLVPQPPEGHGAGYAARKTPDKFLGSIVATTIAGCRAAIGVRMRNHRAVLAGARDFAFAR
ncbi:MAG TPA: hypothetical protein VEK33_07275 [Terriglobales bacterium]|nr:hypothetical protein [Terriglobales bacterium]